MRKKLFDSRRLDEGVRIERDEEREIVGFIDVLQEEFDGLFVGVPIELKEPIDGETNFQVNCVLESGELFITYDIVEDDDGNETITVDVNGIDVFINDILSFNLIGLGSVFEFEESFDGDGAGDYISSGGFNEMMVIEKEDDRYKVWLQNAAGRRTLLSIDSLSETEELLKSVREIFKFYTPFDIEIPGMSMRNFKFDWGVTIKLMDDLRADLEEAIHRRIERERI